MQYRDLESAILSLRDSNVEVFSIGKSTFFRDLYAVHVGSVNGAQIIIQGGIHAREWITTVLVTMLADYYKKASTIGICFLPCTNPDGVRLALEGADWIQAQTARNNLIAINGSRDFSLYKANARGVDINTNFDADWGRGEQNVTLPASANYIGPFANSEKETTALVSFTKEISPIMTISYHSKGQVIYYGFNGQSSKALERDKAIASAIGCRLGYTPILTSNSAGGYKDWCIRHLNVPAFTIEVGSDSLFHPIGVEHAAQIFAKNKRIFEVII